MQQRMTGPDQRRAAIEILTAFLEPDDDFQLARDVLETQLAEGGWPAVMDVAFGLAQIGHVLLSNLEDATGIPMRDVLQLMARHVED